MCCFVIDGKLVTPNVESGVLRGITKAAIAKFGEEIGYPLREAKLPSAQLSKATECFATSATREVMPVSRVCGWRAVSGASFRPGAARLRERWLKRTKTSSVAMLRKTQVFVCSSLIL